MEEYKEKSSYLICDDDLDIIYSILKDCNNCLNWLSLGLSCLDCRFFNKELGSCNTKESLKNVIQLVGDGFPQVE